MADQVCRQHGDGVRNARGCSLRDTQFKAPARLVASMMAARAWRMTCLRAERGWNQAGNGARSVKGCSTLAIQIRVLAQSEASMMAARVEPMLWNSALFPRLQFVNSNRSYFLSRPTKYRRS